MINPDLGVILINSQFIPELNVNLYMKLSDKNKGYQLFGVSYNVLLFASTINMFKPDFYSFTTLKYKFKPGSVNEIGGLGLSVGHLTNKRGDFMPANTWKFSIDINLGKYTISLEMFIYKTGENRTWLPTLGLLFNFY